MIFPEPADLMAVYRLHRGVDARDVASAHAAAAAVRPPGFKRLIVSGASPFTPSLCQGLWDDAPAVLAAVAPDLVQAFAVHL